ncbi:MAG: helix-turn-helix transcriptional regulator [Nitrospira sp.]|nr:helix-turn-helix transcriptional regulator [Nitrospira sp.]
MKHRRTTSDENSHSLVTDVFGTLSKEELLAALSLMHQILDAERKRDMDRIGAALSSLQHKIAPRRASGKHQAADAPTRRGHSPHDDVVGYFFACVEKMHARLDGKPSHSHIPGNSCHLSPRELTVLLWMKEGKTNWEIAQILELSERTVRFHVGGIFEKLDVTSRTQAVARALGAGLIAS